MLRSPCRFTNHESFWRSHKIITPCVTARPLVSAVPNMLWCRQGSSSSNFHSEISVILRRNQRHPFCKEEIITNSSTLENMSFGNDRQSAQGPKNRANSLTFRRRAREIWRYGCSLRPLMKLETK
ncbi:hypothetical protein V6N11_023817 [Hibiscus sabdariffa]|uniref:Uncharacterized protein n=1 Tax=Hibiscus sabdariffa TaxID=183260 RepID=A0ABR2TNK5_9ROSI